MAKKIAYKAGYKYQLKNYYAASTGIIPRTEINTDYISLDFRGVLSISPGYAWDGPSGPTFDTKSFMRGSLEHDAMYQLMRLGLLPQSYREAADQRLRQVCLEDGMWPARAWWVYRTVRKHGGPSAQVGSEQPILLAP